MAGTPFPSDLFAVADPTQNTGLRVNLPKPDCLARPSDCQDLDVINTLDGFNLQPRLSIPFDGPIDVTTVTSETVFLISLGDTLDPSDQGGHRVGINQVVWDPATNTLHVESDELLDQHTRYGLIVTNGLHDPGGRRVEASEAFRRFRHDLNFGQTSDRDLKDYRKALLDAFEAARAAGVRESDIVLDLAAQVKRGLEAQGFQVLQTRSGNEDPSFDDRSALVNAQTGAIFLSLHVSSTGLSGTVRVYAMPEMALPPMNGGLIPWEQAQAAYLPLSRRLGDAVQGELAQKFKGSPTEVQTASIRQLRTTAAPAIAVEISSVSIAEKADLDRMLPGVADAVVRGVVTFRPSYVTAAPASVSAPVVGVKP